MNDNEKVAALQEQLLQDVNAAALPLAVKAMTLENLLLRVRLAMDAAKAPAEEPAAAQEGAAHDA